MSEHTGECKSCDKLADQVTLLTAEVERLTKLDTLARDAYAGLKAEVERQKDAVAENNELGSEVIEQATEIRSLQDRIAALEAERATWAERIIASRNALIQNNCNEGYHQLYMLDDGVESDPFKPWVDLEAIAMLAPPQEPRT